MNILTQFSRPIFLLLIVLIISSFTHVWNAVGFPDIFFDEGVYMRRAMHVLSGLGPQEAYFYDHPFFGQLFLGGILAMIGYPNSLNPVPDPNSISALYLAPRIIMGLLAVVDTFLIYKIAEKRYDKKVAFVASLLFAVMPMTWILRRILLDSILLPFLLSSILLALYSRDSKHKNVLILFSGILLGLAIFTKIPAFTMIPLIAYLVYFNKERNLKTLALWFVPVILIPLLWPFYSVENNQFDLWIQGIQYQTGRHSEGLPYISYVFFLIDPVLFILGISGIIFTSRKDYFILMWFIPYIIFLYLIGFNQYFYWISVLPVFCITAALLIIKILQKINAKKIQRILPFVVISGIGLFGLISTTMIITTNVSDSEFKTAAYVLQLKTNADTTILASPTYSWIFNYVFHKENVLIDYSQILFGPIKTNKVLLIADPHFMIDINRGKQLQDIYNSTNKIATFDGDVLNYDLSKYPYTSMAENYEASHIEIRTK